MSEEETIEPEQLSLGGMGARLREAREEKGLSIAQISAETRIPQRQLRRIEDGLFHELPGRTYAVGFARNYARVVGMDQAEVAEGVRAELGVDRPLERVTSETFEPGDPARVPSGRLAWFSLLAAIVFIAGVVMFYRTFWAPGMGPGSILPDEQGEQGEQVAGESSAGEGVAASGEVSPPSGQVVFTALEDAVWVRFYEAEGERLLEKQMAKGERFAIPNDAAAPQIWTGRPDAFAVTIGGRPVAKLAQDDFVMRDQPIDAASLLERSARDDGENVHAGSQ